MKHPISKKLIVLTAFNALWIICAISVMVLKPSVFSIIWTVLVGTLLTTLTVFLLKKRAVAFFLLGFFYLAFCVEINFESFSWAAVFGPLVFIHLYNSPVGVNPPICAALVLLVFSYREMKK